MTEINTFVSYDKYLSNNIINIHYSNINIKAKYIYYVKYDFFIKYNKNIIYYN